MVDYREILRLNSLKYTQRQIAASVHSSRNTISEVIKLAAENNLCWPLDDQLTNEKVYALLYPNKLEVVNPRKEPDYSYIHKELAKPGVNLTLLWTEYCSDCYASKLTPYMYTQFCDKYRKWARLTKATMRITHKPGDAMQVDWAGTTIPYYDRVTGEATDSYLFAVVLPCSCYAYVEACDDMKTTNWLLCHVHAYQYFGGVTRLLIPDNLKTGVSKNTRYETILNKSYAEMAEYYETAIVPARVRAPQDKSLAEGTVKFATTWIIAVLRNRKFFSLEEIKSAVKEKLDELNITPFKKREGWIIPMEVRLILQRVCLMRLVPKHMWLAMSRTVPTSIWDADRCIAVDENGMEVHEDYILYVCGKYLKECGRLQNNTVVATIMSNMGLFKAMKREGIEVCVITVGDKYVNEAMVANGYVLGGEQSGHIIFSKHATTGDGILTALMLMEVIMEKKQSLGTLCRGMQMYPQLLKNVKVEDKDIQLQNLPISKMNCADSTERPLWIG